MPSPLDAVQLPFRILDAVEKIARELRALPTLVGRIDQLGEAVLAMRADLEGMRADLRDVPGGLEEMRDDLAGMREDLGGVPGGLEDMRGNLAGMRSDLDDVPGGLERTSARVAELHAGLAGVPERIAAMQAGIETMAADLAATRASVEPMDTDLHKVEQAMLTLPPKLDDMTRQLDGLREDLSGLPFVGKS